MYAYVYGTGAVSVGVYFCYILPDKRRQLLRCKAFVDAVGILLQHRFHGFRVDSGRLGACPCKDVLQLRLSYLQTVNLVLQLREGHAGKDRLDAVGDLGLCIGQLLALCGQISACRINLVCQLLRRLCVILGPEKRLDLLHHKFCKENDLRPLQDRLTIARWDRKQAAAAREAAKKNVANYADSGIMNVQKAEPASLRFLSNRDGLYKNAANIKPLDGFEDIVCHSDSVTLEFHDPDSGETIANVSAKRMAQYIRDSDRYTGKPIRLIACQSGAWEFGPAQQLADELGVDVLAPSETVYVMPDGKMYITDDPRGRMEEINTGEWVLFKPRR